MPVVDVVRQIAGELEEIRTDLRPALPPDDPRYLRLLRLATVRELVGLSGSTIWRMRRRGTFPAPVALGENSVAWRSTDIAAWIATRPTR